MIKDQERLEQFVKAWQTCTLAEVATMFDISKRDASAIATSLRARRVKLRDRRCADDSAMDYVDLAKLAREAGRHWEEVIE